MRNKILVVDDSLFNRQVLIDVLKGNYETEEASNGLEALEIIESSKNDIIAVLLDIVMPEMDGLELLKRLNEKGYLGEFPVLMVTGENSFETLAECFEYGASDYIRKPVQKDFVLERVNKMTELYLKNHEYKEQVNKQTMAIRAQYKMLQKQSEQLAKTNESIIEIFGTIVENRNLENRYHVKRVSGFSEIIANSMMENYSEYELTKDKIKLIASTSMLHDLGKVLLEDTIVFKPGKLTPEERDYISSHPLKGYEFIDSISDIWDAEYVKYCKEITRYHHERYDGKGYPDGLKGDEIPISAQIVSIADAYEHLVSESMESGAVTYEDAYNQIITGEQGVFSPKLLECFRKCRTQLEEFAEKYSS